MNEETVERENKDRNKNKVRERKETKAIKEMKNTSIEKPKTV